MFFYWPSRRNKKTLRKKTGLQLMQQKIVQIKIHTSYTHVKAKNLKSKSSNQNENNWSRILATILASNETTIFGLCVFHTIRLDVFSFLIFSCLTIAYIHLKLMVVLEANNN